MAKHLKNLKVLMGVEEKNQEDICQHLRVKGFRRYSNGYVSARMTGKENWDSEEMYALADLLGIPDEDLLSYFPRRNKQAEAASLRRIV